MWLFFIVFVYGVWFSGGFVVCLLFYILLVVVWCLCVGVGLYVLVFGMSRQFCLVVICLVVFVFCVLR